jgi:hypothetical protein
MVLQPLGAALQRLQGHQEEDIDRQYFKFALYCLYLDGVSPPYACPLCRVLITGPPVPSTTSRVLIDTTERPVLAIMKVLDADSKAIKESASVASMCRSRGWQGFFLDNMERSRLDSYQIAVAEDESLKDSYDFADEALRLRG